MPTLMKALVYEGPQTMNIRHLPVPEPGHDEVLIRVDKAGICGSELSGYLGHNSLRVPPLVMGHEFSGTIARTGRAAKKFLPGDRVVVNPLETCGECDFCLVGNDQLCQCRQLLGAHKPGAFAEYVVVAESNIYLLPDSVSLDQAALTEPFACAVHLCKLLHLKPDERLLILGAGPIGLFTLVAARKLGLHNIVVADLNIDRLGIVKEIGGIPAYGDEEIDI
ncbi:zinc-dependent alcohol dehydrogenase, partial [Paenibacillus koleovorans]|uniref:zinc-dependent alcohol dehydrogenase n=1 Tax=Paenibacillus koleovorans TaxID=121608 RepID=UPI0013E30E9D